jgi:hypothetical protein
MNNGASENWTKLEGKQHRQEGQQEPQAGEEAELAQAPEPVETRELRAR